MIKRWALVVSGLIAVLVLSYAILELRKPVLDDAVREREAPESLFTELPEGITEYRIDGPDEGIPVVLVSGFSVPFYCWDPVIPALTEAGFRVYRYNHYGRGYSDHVKRRYTPDLFDDQLLVFLDGMKLADPVRLVGLSMGGAISVTFTNRHPERVDRLALVSPAGFPIEEGFTARLVKVPVIGDFIFAAAGDAVLSARNSSNLSRPEDYPEFQTAFEHQLKYRGFGRAILSTLRYMPFSNIPEEYETLGNRNLRIALIWGEKDAVIPFSNSTLVLSTLPHTEFTALPDTGHVSVYENPEGVVRPLITFLQ